MLQLFVLLFKFCLYSCVLLLRDLAFIGLRRWLTVEFQLVFQAANVMLELEHLSL